MGQRKRPVAVTIPNVDIAAGTDSVVEEHAALAVYNFIGKFFVSLHPVLIVQWKTYRFQVELALETCVGILVIALDYSDWNFVTIAVDVEIVIANREMVDHEPYLQREVEETER